MTHSNVNHEHRRGSEVLAHLKILVISETVGRPIMPILVVVSRTLLNLSYSLLPLEGITIAALSLHITSTGETEERRLGVSQ